MNETSILSKGHRLVRVVLVGYFNEIERSHFGCLGAWILDVGATMPCEK